MVAFRKSRWPLQGVPLKTYPFAALQDAQLRHTLQFGIGLHHAGLNEGDRSTVEHLFVAGKIQVGA